MKKYLTILAFLMPVLASAQTTVLSLEECLESAEKYNRTLHNAALNIQMAEEQKKEAFTKYFPEISANVMAFVAFDKMIQQDGYFPMELAALEQINPNLAALAGQPFAINELDKGMALMATITQPLFVGGQIVNGNKLANLGKEVAELQSKLQTEEVLQKITENYYQIVKIKYNMATIKSAQAQLHAIYKEVKNYVDAGVTTRNDLIKVRLELQQLSSDSLKTANAHHVMCLLLAQQIGKAGESIDVKEGIDFRKEDPAYLYTSPDEAVRYREELALAQKNVDAHKLKVRMEVGKNLPTVAVGVSLSHMSLGGLSDGAKSIIDSKSNNGMAFGTVSLPLSAWWGGSKAIRREKLALELSENQMKDAREQLIIDTEASWMALEEAHLQIGIAITSVMEARENMRMSYDKYRMGTEILSDLLESETLLRKSEDRLSEARANYLTKRADYIRKTR